MKPTPARQRQQAHKLRLALPRALHAANLARRSYQHMRAQAYKRGQRMPRVRVSKALRCHRAKLLSVLLRA